MLTLRSLRAALGELTEHMRAQPTSDDSAAPTDMAPIAQPILATERATDESAAETPPTLATLQPLPGAASATDVNAVKDTASAETTKTTKTTQTSARRSRAFPYRDVIGHAAGFWLATRIAYAFFTYFAVMFQNANPAHEFLTVGPSQLLASWDRWDALWYIHIAQSSYWTPQAAAFFPLYPILIKVASFFTLGNWVLAALLASNVGTLLAFIGVALLAVQETRSRGVAMRAVYLLAAFPLAFFLVAPYTEGWFIACVALSFFCARRGSWVWAAVWAFCGALVRPTGAILLPALLWELGRQQGLWAALWVRLRLTWAGHATGQMRARLAAVLRDDRARLVAWWHLTPYREIAWWRSGAWRHDAGVRRSIGFVAVIAAVPCALLVFMAILQAAFGHPLLFLHVQRIYWRRDGAPIWNAVSGAVGQIFTLPPWSYYQARDLVDLAPVLAFGIITVIAARRMPFMFTIYMVGLIYVAVSTPVTDSPDPDLLISAGRFMLTAIPIFIVLAQWTRRRPNWTAGLLIGGFLIQAVLASFFLAWGWLI